MADEITGNLDTLIQETLDADTDFTESIKDMSDEDKEDATEKKRVEIAEAEITRLRQEEKKASDNSDLADNYKKRAEKAENDLKTAKEALEAKAGTEKPEPVSDLSTADFYALTDAKVPQEDVAEVQKAAKLLEKTIPEALKDEMVLEILKRRQEHRDTETAANKNDTRRGGGGGEITDAEILRKHKEEGYNPEAGTEEAEQLFWARRGGKPKDRD